MQEKPPQEYCGGVKTIYFSASETATAQATVIPTIGLLPAPIRPIISVQPVHREEKTLFRHFPKSLAM